MNARVYDVVSRRGTYYATVCRQPAAADGHDKARPWLLLHGDGRVHRAPSLRLVRAEARHAYPHAVLRKAG